jgi:hypothetical protein
MQNLNEGEIQDVLEFIRHLNYQGPSGPMVKVASVELRSKINDELLGWAVINIDNHYEFTQLRNPSLPECTTGEPGTVRQMPEAEAAG